MWLQSQAQAVAALDRLQVKAPPFRWPLRRPFHLSPFCWPLAGLSLPLPQNFSLPFTAFSRPFTSLSLTSHCLSLPYSPRHCLCWQLHRLPPPITVSRRGTAGLAGGREGERRPGQGAAAGRDARRCGSVVASVAVLVAVLVAGPRIVLLLLGAGRGLGLGFGLGGGAAAGPGLGLLGYVLVLEAALNPPSRHDAASVGLELRKRYGILAAPKRWSNRFRSTSHHHLFGAVAQVRHPQGRAARLPRPAGPQKRPARFQKRAFRQRLKQP